ncbi:MAG: hypothetical protein Q9160_007784 [Pyrenula sp. 1 TL-2023]
MSKPISFGFGKSKPAKPSTPAPAPTSQRAAINDPLKKPLQKSLQKPLRADSDSEDESAPHHETVTGFDISSGGAISSHVSREKQELIINNPGNADWRRRGRKGKNILPAEVQAQRNGAVADSNTIERDEISKAAGLQYATPRVADEVQAQEDIATNGHDSEPAPAPSKPRTDDEIALQALLNDGSGERRTDFVIQQSGNANANAAYEEEKDFQSDVASRPDSCTLEEYAAMPVEDFGLAMLRGMGTKRKANGQPVALEVGKKNNEKAKSRDPQPRSGYLGIGAKGVPSGGEVELGAWGKADMRRNKKGEGLYTPVTLKNKITGETITEQELEERQKAIRNGTAAKEEDWRDRRDRNLQERGRDRMKESSNSYKDQMSSFSRSVACGRDREEKRNGFSSRERSRSRERDRKPRDRRDDDRNGYARDRHRDDRDRGHRQGRYGDDDRYDSNSSGRESHRESRRNTHDRDRDRRRANGH